MVALVIAVIGFYTPYWFSGGPDFGARYWFLALIPLVILTARGLQTLEAKLQPAHFDSYKANLVLTAVLILNVLALVNYFPWRAVDKYFHYLEMRPDIQHLATQYNFGKSIVLIRGNSSDYESAWIYNPLDPHADAPVYAWDRDPEIRNQVLNAYIDRPVWVVNGPSLTHRGYEVVEKSGG